MTESIEHPEPAETVSVGNKWATLSASGILTPLIIVIAIACAVIVYVNHLDSASTASAMNKSHDEATHILGQDIEGVKVTVQKHLEISQKHQEALLSVTRTICRNAVPRVAQQECDK